MKFEFETINGTNRQVNKHTPANPFRFDDRYESEAAVAEAFDSAVNLDHFYVFREVTGAILQRRLGDVSPVVRIDRILWPKPGLEGWNAGPIGVELKRGGTKVGPAITQCIDYQRAVFRLDRTGGGVDVWLRFVALCPLGSLFGDIGSVMYDQRILGCGVWNGQLWFKDASRTYYDGSMRYPFPEVRKTGNKK